MKLLSLPFIFFSFFMCAASDLACPPKRRAGGGKDGSITYVITNQMAALQTAESCLDRLICPEEKTSKKIDPDIKTLLNAMRKLAQETGDKSSLAAAKTWVSNFATPYSTDPFSLGFVYGLWINNDIEFSHEEKKAFYNSFRRAFLKYNNSEENQLKLTHVVAFFEGFWTGNETKKTFTSHPPFPYLHSSVFEAFIQGLEQEPFRSTRFEPVAFSLNQAAYKCGKALNSTENWEIADSLEAGAGGAMAGAGIGSGSGAPTETHADDAFLDATADGLAQGFFDALPTGCGDGSASDVSEEHVEWGRELAASSIAAAVAPAQTAVVETTLDAADCSFFRGFYRAQSMPEAMKINLQSYYTGELLRLSKLPDPLNNMNLISYLDGAIEALLLGYKGLPPRTPTEDERLQALFTAGVAASLKRIAQRPDISVFAYLAFYRGIAVQVDLNDMKTGHYESRTMTSGVPVYWDSCHEAQAARAGEIAGAAKGTSRPRRHKGTEKAKATTVALTPEELKTKTGTAEGQGTTLLAAEPPPTTHGGRKQRGVHKNAFTPAKNKTSTPAPAVTPKRTEETISAGAAAAAATPDEFDETEWTVLPIKPHNKPKVPPRDTSGRERFGHPIRADAPPSTRAAEKTDPKPSMASAALTPPVTASSPNSTSPVAPAATPKPSAKASSATATTSYANILTGRKVSTSARPAAVPSSSAASGATSTPEPVSAPREAPETATAQPDRAVDGEADVALNTPHDIAEGTTHAPPADSAGLWRAGAGAGAAKDEPARFAHSARYCDSDGTDDKSSAPSSVASVGVSSDSSHGSGVSVSDGMLDTRPLTKLTILDPKTSPYAHGMFDGTFTMLQAPTRDLKTRDIHLQNTLAQIGQWNAVGLTRTHPQELVANQLSYLEGFKAGIIQGNNLQSDCFYRGKRAFGNVEQARLLKEQIMSLALPYGAKRVLLETMAFGIAKAIENLATSV